MTTPLDFRMPPSDCKAEEAVLGVCLRDPQQTPSMLGIVKPADFFWEKNGAVLSAIGAVYERDGVNAISRRAVLRELEMMGRAEEVGGAAYLSEVSAALEITQGGEYWARAVAQAAFYRRTLSALSVLTDQAYRQPDDMDRFLDDAVEGILGLAGGRRRGEMQTFKELMDDSLGSWLEGHMEAPGRLSGIPTGIGKLDELLDGLQRGSLYILAAETSAGKSLFAHNLVLWLAQAGSKFLVISSEMTNRSVGKRIVFLGAGVDPVQMRREGVYDWATREKVRDMMEAVVKLPVTFWNPGTVTFASIRSAVRKLKARGGIDVLVIDHIDHVGGGTDRRTQELELLMRQVKGLAESEDIAIVAISHMSRATGGGKISRLKNSSSKEQDADVVMFLTPMKAEDGAWVEMSMEEAQVAKARDNWLNIRLDVHKNREGSTGFVDLVMSWNLGGQYYEAGKYG